jgi:hypothetical protein
LGLKIESLQQEIIDLRRRKSVTGDNAFPSRIELDFIQPNASSVVSISAGTHSDNVSLPGSASVDFHLAPVMSSHSSAVSRPVAKIRRALVPLPAPTPRQ